MNFDNWVLNKYSKFIVVFHDDFASFIDSILPSKMIQNGIPLGGDPMLGHHNYVNWSMLDKKFCINYEAFYGETDSSMTKQEYFGKKILESPIGDYESIIAEFGYSNPVVKIPTKLYCQNWLEFLNGATWEGLIVSEDFLYVMEFVRYNGHYLYTNFDIDL